MVVGKSAGTAGAPGVVRDPLVSDWNSTNRPPAEFRTNASLLYSLSLRWTTRPAHCQWELCSRVIFVVAVQSPAGTGWPAKLTGPVFASLMSPVVTGRFNEPPDWVIGLPAGYRRAHFGSSDGESNSSDSGPVGQTSGSLIGATGSTGSPGLVSIANCEKSALFATVSCDISKIPMSWVAAAPARVSLVPT